MSEVIVVCNVHNATSKFVCVKAGCSCYRVGKKKSKIKRKREAES